MEPMTAWMLSLLAAFLFIGIRNRTRTGRPVAIALVTLASTLIAYLTFTPGA
jgi:hypothetical protein